MRREEPSQNQLGRVATPILVKEIVMRREELVTEYQTEPAGASCTFHPIKENVMETGRTVSVIKTAGVSSTSNLHNRDRVTRTEESCTFMSIKTADVKTTPAHKRDSSETQRYEK
jgi:hypothetical protein